MDNIKYNTTDGKVILTGIEVLKVDTVYPSGNIYPRTVVENSLKQVQWSVPVSIDTFSKNPTDMLMSDLTNIAGQATDLRVEGDSVIGNVTVFNTPAGNILNELLNHNMMSFNLFGTVVKDESNVINDSYRLLGINVSLKEDQPND